MMAWVDFGRLHEELRAAFPELVEMVNGEAVAQYTISHTGTGADVVAQVGLRKALDVTQAELDAVLAAHDPDVLELSADVTQIAVGDVEHATISARLHDRDGVTRVESRTVQVLIGDETGEVELTDGVGSFTVGSLVVGAMIVRPAGSMPGTSVSIEVTA